jgi:hypothetical protein
LEEVFSDVEETRRAFDSMPSFDLAVTLKTALHRDPAHRWTTNDIHDIDALGSTLPYCDIVVTDSLWSSHALAGSHSGWTGWDAERRKRTPCAVRRRSTYFDPSE